MPRKPTPTLAIEESKLNEAVLQEDTASLNQLAVVEQQATERVVALAAKLNYQGSLDLASLENSARDAIRRIGMSVFELGAFLLLLREGAGYGSFLPTLARLNLEERAARQYMQVTRRFSNRQTSADLSAIGISKLTEMLVLDDEQMSDLLELGQTGELALDKVATMSVRELRANLREAKLEKEADDKMLAKKNAEIDKLSRRIAKATPDDVLLELQKEATALMNDALGCIRGQLRQACIALKNHGDDDHSLFMAGLLGQVQADLTALRQEFDLPDVSTAADQALLAEQAQWANT